MRCPTRLAFALPACALLACGGGDDGAADRPGATDASRSAPAGEERRAPLEAQDPRLVLFEVRAQLERLRTEEGDYPAVGEFTLEARYAPLRALLDARFDEWRYRSEGDSYTLVATVDGRQYGIASPGAPDSGETAPDTGDPAVRT